MPDIQLRPTVASDLSRLMGFDHSITSESVWQLELRRDTGQVSAVFREVRLPRSIVVSYPHNPFALADDWVRRSMMYTAFVGQDPAGYISLLERGSDSVVWVTDLVVNEVNRRKGVGSALLTAAQEWSSARSHRRLILEMQSKNLPAIRIAQKLGYEFCGYNDHYYLNQDVALFFAKALK
ncbi:MAG TPA: GNAT family N-acetyltransferase [Anaerolineales bacterium]|nr:GNAT family N-acetyltransferase [Anaerolineales bacterium]